METHLNLEDSRDVEELNKAIAALHKLTAIITKYLPGQPGVVFQFTDLDSLSFLKPAEATTLSNTESLQIVMSLKSILVSPPMNQIAGEDFKHFMTQLGFIVETGLRLKYVKELKNEQGLVFLNNAVSIRNSATTLVQNSFAFQKSKSIPYKELVQLIRKLGTYHLIPYGLSERSVELFLPTLFSRVLAKTPSTKKPVASDLRPEHFQTILDSVNEWIAIQSSFLSALSNRDQIRASELIEKFNQSARSVKDAKRSIAFKQMVDILDKGVFLRWIDQDRLNFAPRDLNQNFSRYDLLFLSTSFSVMRAIMRGYIVDPTRRQGITAMSEPELEDLYLSVRNMGRDLKFIDIRNRSAPSRAFLEHNIFTSVSNGNDMIEFHESIEWLYQVWSAGNMGTKIYDMVPAKCKTRELDVFGHRKLDHACYTAYFKAHVTEFFEHLPLVTNYLRGILSPDQPTAAWDDFDASLENAFRATGYSTDDFDSPDTEAMALILSYTENIFINHNQAHDGVLNSSDIWSTYPIMEGFIEKASNGQAKKDWMKELVYSYLITIGEIPEGKSILHISTDAKVLLHFKKETARVPNIVKVISSFSILGKNGKIKDLEAYYNQNKDNLETKIQNKDPKTMADLLKLYYCTDESLGDFTAKISHGARQIFTSGIDASEFHKNTEKLIKADPMLILECLPFE